MKNDFFMRVKACLINEAFIRSAITSFISYLNPSIDVIQEIKTAVSEAVTNCMVHAYPNKEDYIDIDVSIEDQKLLIKIKDYGIGIENINKAREPFFSTKKDEERTGMGFTLMETFMDSLIVRSQKNIGTEVVMEKSIGV